MGATVPTGHDGSVLLEEVPPADSVAREIVALVERRSLAYQRHYRCSLKVKRIWRVCLSAALQQVNAAAESLGRASWLFHGTSQTAAKCIIENGFQLPTRSGMFGKGVYFARCPLKSVGYARYTSSFTKLRRLFSSKPGPAADTRVMLVCDVHLGRSKTLRRAAPYLTSSEQLQPGPLTRLCFPDQKYDSVYVPGGLFCCYAVNVDEYVIFDPTRAIPRYMLEFEVEPIKLAKASA